MGPVLAMDTEWNRLLEAQVWDPANVRDADDVAAETLLYKASSSAAMGSGGHSAAMRSGGKAGPASQQARLLLRRRSCRFFMTDSSDHPLF